MAALLLLGRGKRLSVPISGTLVPQGANTAILSLPLELGSIWKAALEKQTEDVERQIGAREGAVLPGGRDASVGRMRGDMQGSTLSCQYSARFSSNASVEFVNSVAGPRRQSADVTLRLRRMTGLMFKTGEKRR